MLIRKLGNIPAYGRTHGLGLEPRLHGPEPCVLPLDDPRALCGTGAVQRPTSPRHWRGKLYHPRALCGTGAVQRPPSPRHWRGKLDDPPALNSSNLLTPAKLKPVK